MEINKVNNRDNWFWIFMIVFLIFIFFSEDADAFEDCTLTKQQETVVRFSYAYGDPHDYGYTMIAIAMQESRLGKWRLNLDDPSAGTYHTTLDKGLKKLGWANNPYNRNRVAQMMIDDEFFAAELALETIIWWDAYHKGDWRSVVSSYNGGFRGNPAYVDMIAKNIQTIKRCGWLDEPAYITYGQ